jgi:hypothetical protein
MKKRNNAINMLLQKYVVRVVLLVVTLAYARNIYLLLATPLCHYRGRSTRLTDLAKRVYVDDCEERR